MKTKSFLIAALIIGGSASYAQQVEIDDMYFSSKDRAALNASKPLPTIKSNDEVDAVQPKNTAINPTDSYSGRGTNPDYTSQTAVSSKASKTNLGYFNNTYQPKSINQNLAYQPTGLNNLYNYSNNNYGYNGFNNSMNPYGSFYSPYYGMGMSPYYGLGLSSMFGWGGYSSYGMGYGYPYSGFYSNNYYGYGYSPYGYGYSYYPTTVVVVNNDGNSGYVYGKRGGRNGSDNYYNGNRSRSTSVSNSNNNSGNTGGRVASNQYYDRSWRNSVPQGTATQTRSYYGNSSGYNSTSTNTRSSWDGGNGQSSFGNSRSSYNYGNSNNGFGGGSRSSFSGGGGGSSSGGGGNSGGGGGGRSRH